MAETDFWGWYYNGAFPDAEPAEPVAPANASPSLSSIGFTNPAAQIAYATSQKGPYRLTPNVGFPPVGSPAQVAANGGLNPQQYAELDKPVSQNPVNALGYTAAGPALSAAQQAIDTATTPRAAATPAASVPQWISRAAAQQQTPVQALRAQGYSPAAAYDLANINAQNAARENASSPSHQSSNSWFNEVTGR